MEVVRNVIMNLRIETNKRKLEKEFRNLSDLNYFMAHFFSSEDVADRRFQQADSFYAGQERRLVRSARQEIDAGDNNDTEVFVGEEQGESEGEQESITMRPPQVSAIKKIGLAVGGIAFCALVLLFGFAYKSYSEDLRQELKTMEQISMIQEKNFIKLAGQLHEIKILMASPKESQQLVETELGKLYQEMERLEEKVSLIVLKEGTPASEPEQMDEPEKKVYYKVRSGETLFRIAKNHGITVEKLCELNKISSQTHIHPGQELVVAF